jgi:hypothetical protein
MSKVSAIIFLFHKKGRTTNSRYGQFVRPDKSPHPDAQDLHLWLGRELTIDEFNDELPKAIRSVLTTDPVSCRIIVRGADEADTTEAIETLKAEHAAALEAVQAGVNAFTAEANSNIALLNAANDEQAVTIRTLETELAALKGASDATKPESLEPSEAPVVEAAPAPAGESGQDAAPSTTTVSPAATKKKAKK